MEKDLANVKALAMILENEYNQLRTAKIPPAGAAIVPPPSENAAENAEKTEPTDGDVKMEEEQQQPSEEEPEPEPRESGSTAVERRVERLLSDFRESGALDGDNEKALEAKKVRTPSRQLFAWVLTTHCRADCAILGFVPCLPPSCLSHMLLLRTRNRPC